VARNRKRSRDRRAPGSADATGLATAAGGAPDPLAHATPDTELAEAQLALGRPDLSDVSGGSGDGDGGGGFDGGSDDGGSGLTPGGERHPAHQQGAPARLANFLRGSWRELQRVQWPDRRQVMQATGVVIGFVIVAGVFLGVADVVAQKIVNLVLK
jgi:preprotein translocase subunit SecE